MASLMTAAAERLDYDLSWAICQDFHQYAVTLNLHILDDPSSSSATSNSDPSDQDVKRKLVWHVIQFQTLMALCLRRPTNLLISNFHVDLPVLASTLPADTMTLFVLASRMTFIVSQFLKLVQADHNPDQDVFVAETETCCLHLEALLEEWNVYEDSTDLSDNLLPITLDYLVFGHTALLLMDRMIYDTSPPSPRALQAARKSLRFIHLAAQLSLNPLATITFIAFYPFEAFFTLHYDLLSRDKPTRCQDRCLLEDFAAVLQTIIPALGPFAPLAHAVDFINIVKRLFETERSDTGGVAAVDWLQSQGVVPSQLTAFAKRADPAALSRLGEAFSLALEALEDCR